MRGGPKQIESWTGQKKPNHPFSNCSQQFPEAGAETGQMKLVDFQADVASEHSRGTEPAGEDTAQFCHDTAGRRGVGYKRWSSEE